MLLAELTAGKDVVLGKSGRVLFPIGASYCKYRAYLYFEGKE